MRSPWSLSVAFLLVILAVAAGGCRKKENASTASSAKAYPGDGDIDPWLRIGPQAASIEASIKKLSYVLYPKPGPGYPRPGDIEKAIAGLKGTPGILDAKLVRNEGRREIKILTGSGQQIYFRVYDYELIAAIEKGRDFLNSKLSEGVAQDEAVLQTVAYLKTLPGRLEAHTETLKGSPAVRVSVADDQFDYIYLPQAAVTKNP